MRSLSLVLAIAVYFPLGAQIVFEAVDPVPGTFIRNIDESSTGLQSVVTSEGIFGKAVTGSSWIESDQYAATIYDVMYSPDGDLYTKNDSMILYSQNNGETFSVINWPNGIYPPFNYSYVYVLDNDVLFINDDSGHCFYTINNGQSWHWVGQLILSSDPVVRMVDNFIYVADPSWVGAGIIARINVNSGDIEIVDMISLADPYDVIFSQIAEDGTIYMFGRDNSGPSFKDHLLQYKFGQDVKSIGPFPNPTDAWSFFAVGLALYNFDQHTAYVFNGTEFEPQTYVGIPQDGEKFFFLAENNHVYAVVDHKHIFRSVRTLAYPGSVSGKIFLDEDQGCTPQATETGLAFWNVTIEGEHFFHEGISKADGTFKYAVPDGEYTVSTQPPGTGWIVCKDDINVTVDTNHPFASVNFLSQATDDCANLSLDFSTPLLRRCFENYYTIRVRNTGPQASTGTTLVLQLDPFFEFHSASIPSNQIDASTVSFNLGKLDLNAELTFRMYFTISCQAELGFEHCLSGNLTADKVCNYAHTFVTECQANIGSIDPNDKRAFNEDGKESDRVDKDEYITYHIRFQNTGTDTAFTVRILDPLSSYLDLSTLEMLSASHPYTYEITDGPMLIVDFKHILLPDSTTNEAASHGFLKFRVKPLASFDYGTTIPNQADIFFDFNEPVVTNETMTLITPVVGVHDQREQIEFTVFPNPAKDILELRIAETYRQQIEAWIIYDSHGRIATQGISLPDHALNITSLIPGAYSLVLVGNKKVLGSKTFVKE